MKIRLIPLLFALATTGALASTQPTINPIEVVARKEANGTIKNDNNRNAANSLNLPVVSKEKAAQSNKHTEKPSPQESETVHYGNIDVVLRASVTDIATVFFSFVLMIVAILQFAITRRALGDSKNAANAALKSAEVAHQALVNLERPFLVLKKIDATKIDDFFNSEIRVSIYNGGRTPAVIGPIDLGIIVSNILPEQRPVPEAGAYNLVIPNGEFLSFGVSLQDKMTPELLGQIRNNITTLYLYCVLKCQYGSSFYTTAIFQRYSPELGVFGPDGGTKHNYLT
jgi:hypothetical protein